VVLLLALFAWQQSGAQSTIDNNDVSKHVWDLAPSYYANDDDWEKERQYIINKLPTIPKLKGTLGKSAMSLADGLDAIRDIRWRAHKMTVYGILTSSIDYKSEKAQSQLQTGNLLETEVESAISFMEAEIIKIERKKLELWQNTEPRLNVHKRTIQHILITGKYSLDEGSQTILNKMAGRWPLVAGDVYQNLIESDLGWPVISGEDGKPLTLDPNTYQGVRGSSNAELVKKANEAFFEKLKHLENTFGILLTRRIEADATVAKFKGLDDAIDAFFYLKDGAPSGTYKKMIGATLNNKSLLQKYILLRNKAICIENNHLSNIYIPYSAFTKTFPLSETKERLLQIALQISPQFQSEIKNLLTKPFFHLPPAPDKRAAYGIYPPIGRGNTFMIMNYRNRFSNARSFCGGLFLMNAYENVPKDRLADTRFDPSIYSNALVYHV
jgi:oligoendopeptidase F